MSNTFDPNAEQVPAEQVNAEQVPAEQVNAEQVNAEQVIAEPPPSVPDELDEADETIGVAPNTLDTLPADEEEPNASR